MLFESLQFTDFALRRAPPEVRVQTKTTNDRPRPSENPLLDQNNRRTGIGHASRNSTSWSYLMCEVGVFLWR